MLQPFGSAATLRLQGARLLQLFSHKQRLQEFLRIGYYVNNDYPEGELKESPPAQPRLELLERRQGF